MSKRSTSELRPALLGWESEEGMKASETNKHTTESHVAPKTWVNE